MLTKISIESAESIEDPPAIQKPEIKPVAELAGQANPFAKAGMAKELHVLGFSNKAIGRVLHIHEDAVSHILNIYDQIK